MAGMRMVPVRAGASAFESEDVVEVLAGRDGMVWASIRCVRDVEAMPVNRRWFRQSVSEVDDHTIAFVHLEQRAWNTAVVRISGRIHTRDHRQRRGLRSYGHLDGVRCGRGVHQNRWARYGCDGCRGRVAAHMFVTLRGNQGDWYRTGKRHQNRRRQLHAIIYLFAVPVGASIFRRIGRFVNLWSESWSESPRHRPGPQASWLRLRATGRRKC